MQKGISNFLNFNSNENKRILSFPESDSFVYSIVKSFKEMIIGMLKLLFDISILIVSRYNTTLIKNIMVVDTLYQCRILFSTVYTTFFRLI